MNQILVEAGLTDSEAKVYLTLLDLGMDLAGTIARKSGIHRRSVYDILDRLIEKGLVSYIVKNNQRHYEATDPIRLIELLKEKERKIQEVLPRLQLKYSMTREKQETNFYRGKNGLKTVFEDQLKEGKEILIFGANVDVNEVIKFYFPHFDRARVQKKIKVKFIFSEDARDNPAIKKIPLKEVRYIPKGFSSPAATYIYGNKVAIILWSENPLAILIKQKEIADNYKQFFKFVWDSAKK
ncbi:hypothetical protein DRJ17_02765 [Candidatus Woesearchaeota archaeon]|nr:MAG: hypothetical protein DRJ17_02765 [Candidatus Woesearchaeota archaeon]